MKPTAVLFDWIQLRQVPPLLPQSRRADDYRRLEAHDKPVLEATGAEDFLTTLGGTVRNKALLGTFQQEAERLKARDDLAASLADEAAIAGEGTKETIHLLQRLLDGKVKVTDVLAGEGTYQELAGHTGRNHRRVEGVWIHRRRDLDEDVVVPYDRHQRGLEVGHVVLAPEHLSPEARIEYLTLRERNDLTASEAARLVSGTAPLLE